MESYFLMFFEMMPLHSTGILFHGIEWILNYDEICIQFKLVAILVYTSESLRVFWEKERWWWYIIKAIQVL